MADKSVIEKFILKYSVDADKATKDANRLKKAIEDLSDKSGKSKTKIQAAFRGVTKEVEGTIPAFNTIDKTLGMISKKVIIATAVFASFAAVVKSVNKVSQEYEIQRNTASATGLSASQVNFYQQEFNAANGRMSGEKSRSLLEKVAGLSSAAFTNVNPYNLEAIKLKQAGVSDVRDSEGKIKNTAQILDEIASKFNSVSKQQANAIGLSIGLTTDEVQAIRERNRVTEEGLSKSEYAIERQAKAYAAAERLGEAQGRLNEAWRQSSDLLGQIFIPFFTTVIEKAADIVGLIPKLADNMSKGYEKATSTEKMLLNQHLKLAGYKVDTEDDVKKARREEDERQKQNANFEWQQQQQLKQNINVFSSAVNTFVGAVDERQAWAAWAGQVGQAAGLGLGGNSPTSLVYNGNVTDEYDDLLKKYWGKDWNIAKALMTVESGGNPNAKNPNSTASGLLQVLKPNWLPGENPFDPETSIKQGKRVWDWALKMSNGDVNKAILLYGDRTASYLKKVKSNLIEKSTIAGESKDSVGANLAAEQLAQYIGVSKGQLLRGNTSRADSAKALRNSIFEQEQSVAAAQAKLGLDTLRPTDRAQAQRDLITATAQLNNLKVYGDSIVKRGFGSINDNTTFTADKPDKAAIIVNIHGDVSQEQITKNLFLVMAIDDLVNNAANNGVAK